MQQCYMPGGRRNNNSPATGDFVGRTGPDLYGLERRRTGPEFVLHNIQRWVLGTAAQLPQHRIECSPGPLGLLLRREDHGRDPGNILGPGTVTDDCGGVLSELLVEGTIVHVWLLDFIDPSRSIGEFLSLAPSLFRGNKIRFSFSRVDPVGISPNSPRRFQW
jgi:hypothetical protein